MAGHDRAPEPWCAHGLRAQLAPRAADQVAWRNAVRVFRLKGEAAAR
ncbi:hypothetical protein [Ramlibacter humi]|nr:hypothetical protein [Ramlibacter humi]